MLALLMNLLILVSACVAIHLVGIRWLQHLWPRRDADYVPARTSGLIVCNVHHLLSHSLRKSGLSQNPS